MSNDARRKITKTPAEHPKYEEMIKAAIRSLKDRNGSSRQAIEKYVKANYKVGDTATYHIKTARLPCKGSYGERDVNSSRPTYRLCV